MDNSTIDDELNSEKITEGEPSQRGDRLEFECSANVINMILSDLKLETINANDKLNMAVGLLNLNLPSCRQSVQHLIECFAEPIIELVLKSIVNIETSKILFMFINQIAKKAPPKPNLCTTQLASLAVNLLEYLSSDNDLYSLIESCILLSELLKFFSLQNFSDAQVYRSLSDSGLTHSLVPNLCYLCQRIAIINVHAANYLFYSFCELLNSLTEESSSLISIPDFVLLTQNLQNERILSSCKDEQIVFYIAVFVNIINENPHFQFQQKSFEQTVYVHAFDTISRLISSYSSSLHHLTQSDFGVESLKEEFQEEELKALLTTVKQSLYILAKLFEGPFLKRASQIILLSNLHSLIYNLFSLLSIDQKLVDYLASEAHERADSKMLKGYLKCNYLGYSALLNMAESLNELEPFSPEFSVFILEIAFGELQKHLQLDSILQTTLHIQSHNKATSEKLLKILIFIKETMEFDRIELASSFTRTIDLDEMANIFDFLIKDPGSYSNDIIVESSDVLITAIHLAKKRIPSCDLSQMITRVSSLDNEEKPRNCD